MSTTTLGLIVDGVIGLAVITAGAVLVALDKFDQSTGIAVIATGVAVVRGSTQAALALKVPVPGETQGGGA